MALRNSPPMTSSHDVIRISIVFVCYPCQIPGSRAKWSPKEEEQEATVVFLVTGFCYASQLKWVTYYHVLIAESILQNTLCFWPLLFSFQPCAKHFKMNISSKPTNLSPFSLMKFWTMCKTSGNFILISFSATSDLLMKRGRKRGKNSTWGRRSDILFLNGIAIARF